MTKTSKEKQDNSSNMEEVAFTLNSEEAIKNGVDATGKRWMLVKDTQRPMYRIRPEKDRSTCVVPKVMDGMFTKVELARDARDKYVKSTWDKAYAKNPKLKLQAQELEAATA